MIVRIDKSFVKDISKIKDKKLRSKVADYIEQVQSSDKVSEITGIKKLTGFKKEYRIRIGNYRIGLQIKDNVVYFIRFLHRSAIYKYFP